MIFVLKFYTYNIKSFQELISQLKLKEFKNNFTINSSFIFPQNSIKRTILKAPHGDKKTGQDSLELVSYTGIIKFSITNLNTFLKLMHLFLKDCYKISIFFIKY